RLHGAPRHRARRPAPTRRPRCGAPQLPRPGRPADRARHRRGGPPPGRSPGVEAALGTVLLVAGYTGSKEDFAPLLAPLAEAGHRVVAIDQRGQYESPGPDDPAAYSVAELAADVVAVARVL